MNLPEVKIDDLLEAGVHFGHNVRRWNPKMEPYIFGKRNNIHIINLEKTVPMLYEALQAIQSIAKNGGKFLFVGTNKLSSSIVAKQALRCDSYYINYRWLGGMLTNWKTVSQRIEYLKTLEQQELDGHFESLPKKEIANKKKELEKLRCYLDGIKDMPRVPDVMIVVDQRRELTAVKEAISLNIPIISILDTNCDPDLVDLPIPGNDDSISSIQLILRVLSTNILSGQE